MIQNALNSCTDDRSSVGWALSYGSNLCGFQSQLEASNVSSHIEELRYKETVCGWYIYIYIYIYIYLAASHEQDTTQGQFSCKFKQIWMSSFPFPKLVAIPRLKSSVCPTIYPLVGGGFIFFKRISAIENAKSSVQDLNSPRPVHFIWR